MSDNYSIKEVIEKGFESVDKHLSEIKEDVRDTRDKVAIQNGRVRLLEDWSQDAQDLIQKTSDVASSTLESYKIDKARFWTAITILTLVGGTLIALSVMAINSKIKEGISEALSVYEVPNK